MKRIVVFALLAVCGFSIPARIPFSWLLAEDSKTRLAVDFIVGGYLLSEGGDWKAAESPLRGPFGIDFDSSGTMYIVELSSGRLHKRPARGELKTLRKSHDKGYSGDGGHVSRAEFNGPHNCVVSADDHLLIADSWNHCVRSVDLKTLRTETLAVTGASGFFGDGGSAGPARFNYIMCIELSPDRKTLHIADLKNRRIRNMNLQTGKVQTVAGNGSRAVPKMAAAPRKVHWLIRERSPRMDQATCISWSAVGTHCGWFVRMGRFTRSPVPVEKDFATATHCRPDSVRPSTFAVTLEGTST